MTPKFFSVTMTDGTARMIPIIVWNGVDDYSNHPPNEIIASVPGPNTLILQVNEKSIAERLQMLATLAKEHDSVVIWAKNTSVYEQAKNFFIKTERAMIRSGKSILQ